MDVRKNIINRLEFLLREIPEKITLIGTDILDKKPAADKWSKKEILGHLCDSAVNNLSRFVRAQIEPPPFEVISYDQNSWVKLNSYQDMTIGEVIEYWTCLNRQIIRIITAAAEEKLAVECILGNAAFREGELAKSLLWLIEDYLLHMEYHLRQIIEEDWLRSNYKTA